tara:strand:+ start:1743 stop:1880 length:138 start_codon:yes stop_codon:yes gene_type:complete
MLFKFGTFWQTFSVVLGAWIFYGIWDFEFTTITLLALILALKIRN